MKKKKIFRHLLITGILSLTALGIIVYLKYPPKLPKDGKHKDRSSNFVCTGCHNNAPTGGSSIKYHFDLKPCIKCHF